MRFGRYLAACACCTLVLLLTVVAARRADPPPPPAQAGNFEPVVCTPLTLPDLSFDVPAGRGATLEYPGPDGRVAILDVPRAAMTTALRFSFSAPDPSRARIEITATRLDNGAEVTDFSAHPPKLTLIHRDGCLPRRAASGNSFYLFMVAHPDSAGLGEFDAQNWPFEGKSRVRTTLCHLSGYILAQGNRPPPDDGGIHPTDKGGNGGNRCPEG